MNKSTLKSIIALHTRIWLDCLGCDRQRYVDALPWIERHGLDIDEPLVFLSRRIRCTRCGRRSVEVKAAPYSNTLDVDRRQTPLNNVACPLCGSGELEWRGPIKRNHEVKKAEQQFKPGHPMVTCECLDCGNWWTQPK